MILRALPSAPRFLRAHQKYARRIHPLREGVARCPAEGSRLRETADVAGMRQIGCAFSGYARGRFLAIPCRVLLASASAPPPCSRKSRYAAIFREIFDLFFKIITRARKITLFRRATLFANTFARAGKVKPRNFDNMRAPKHCAARKTPIAPSIARAMGVVLQSRKTAGVSSPRFS